MNHPFELSGGLRQRAMIAIAHHPPALLIVDRPHDGARCIHAGREILDLIKELQIETGMSVLLITHDLTSWPMWPTKRW